MLPNVVLERTAVGLGVLSCVTSTIVSRSCLLRCSLPLWEVEAWGEGGWKVGSSGGGGHPLPAPSLITQAPVDLHGGDKELLKVVPCPLCMYISGCVCIQNK